MAADIIAAVLFCLLIAVLAFVAGYVTGSRVVKNRLLSYIEFIEDAELLDDDEDDEADDANWWKKGGGKSSSD